MRTLFISKATLTLVRIIDNVALVLEKDWAHSFHVVQRAEMDVLV